MHLFFDKHGNVYYSINNKNYQLNIDINNRPVLYYYNYNIISEETNNKLNYITEKNTIDNESLEKLLNHEETELTEDEIVLKYVPEKYNVILNDYEDKEFVFHYNYEDIKIYNVEDTCSALYDTLVFNVNNSLIFESVNVEINSIYIIKILHNFDIIFRQIGDSCEILYKFDQNNLIFV